MSAKIVYLDYELIPKQVISMINELQLMRVFFKMLTLVRPTNSTIKKQFYICQCHS